MPRSYHLADEPWIPVRWRPDATPTQDGQYPDRLGFSDLLLHSHELAGLAIAEPPAHSALLRILYALTARVAGLDEAGPGDWSDRRLDVLDKGRLSRESIEKYFSTHRERFFLFDTEGARPWMQDARLADQCDAKSTAGVNKLVVTRPAGNNHSWFMHGSDTSPDLPSAADAVLNLLEWHYYGPSGTCSAREVNGVKSARGTAGPLRTALSYHPEGASLLETLLAGLIRPAATVRRAEDACPWEWDELPDPDAAPPTPRGPYSRLTACSQHALLLVPEGEDGARVKDAYITWAYRSGRIPRDDDFLIWQISQEGNRYPRPAESSRALWRDLDALLLSDPPGTAQPRRPKIFDSALEVSEDLRVRALGFEQEAQAKDIQFVDGTTPPVLGVVEERAPGTAPAVGRMRQLGEMYGRRLERAVKRAWAAYVQDAKADGGAWATEAGARYWPHAEAEFWKGFAELDQSETVAGSGFDAAKTRRAFLRLAEEAYESVTASVMRTQRGAQAVSDARIELYGGVRKKATSRPAATSKETA